MKHRKPKQQATTLVELCATLAILGILVVAGTTGYKSSGNACLTILELEALFSVGASSALALGTLATVVNDEARTKFTLKSGHRQVSLPLPRNVRIEHFRFLTGDKATFYPSGAVSAGTATLLDSRGKRASLIMGARGSRRIVCLG